MDTFLIITSENFPCSKCFLLSFKTILLPFWSLISLIILLLFCNFFRLKSIKVLVFSPGLKISDNLEKLPELI